MTKPEYFIDPENIEEMARLDIQAGQLNALLGLHPQGLLLSEKATVLDVACGPGQWSIEWASSHKEATVVGIDISENMLAYATARANEQQLENVRFVRMDVTKKLDLPDNSFDAIYARLLEGFLTRLSWLPFLQECLRVLRPGGVFVGVELEIFAGECPRAQKYGELLIRVLYQRGNSYAPTGMTTAITAMQAPLLKQAGFVNVANEAKGINFSPGEPAHDLYYKDFQAALKLLQPIILGMNPGTEKEVSSLYQDTLRELHSTAGIIGYYNSCWGYKKQEE